MKLVKTPTPIKVCITLSGSLRAYPSIWYAGLASRTFDVLQHSVYKMYEVVEGEHMGRIIDPIDCELN